MDCVDIREAFLQGKRPDGDASREHRMSCAACRELLDASDTVGGSLAAGAASARAVPVAWNAELALTLERDLNAERGLLGKLRAMPTRFRVAVALGVALILALAELVGRRSQLLGSSAPAAIVFVAALAAVLSASLAPLSRPENHKRRMALACVAALIPFASAFVFSQSAEAKSWPGAAAALACFAYGSAFSIPIFIVLCALDRRPRAPLSGALLVGAASGLGASLVLELHCVIRHPVHSMLGHASIGVVWMLGYAVYARFGSASSK